MKSFGQGKIPFLLPGLIAVAAVAALTLWLSRQPAKPLSLRVPGTDKAPDSELGTNSNAVLAGKVIPGDGQPSKLPGAWAQFRGSARDNSSKNSDKLARSWQGSEPRELWAVDLGEGYAGAAVSTGRVYVMDYNRERKHDSLRCLSLDDGRELWRYEYPVGVKRNHGMSRTVPAAAENFVVAIGPKCHVVCVDPLSGELLWGLDLVRQYGATVPPWYAGQCPLIDGTNVILAPGGKEALLLALEGRTGKVLWQTPNPRGWKMTHSSVMPMEFGGQRFYVYCANNGVVGVSATNGAILWQTPEWKISIATVPSPLVLDNGRIFLSGGYNAGSLMLQVKKAREGFAVETAFRLPPEVFGATQHTPILYENHIYGVRPDGRFACLSLDGKVVWTSESAPQFGLGPFLFADGMFFAMNDSGLLRLIEATPEGCNFLGQAQVLKGRESWGPMALAGTRLLARDLTRMVCLEVGKKQAP
jgi:outer membrane protein assembly factor BamB